MQKGSRISYHYFVKFNHAVDEQKLVAQIRPVLEATIIITTPYKRRKKIPAAPLPTLPNFYRSLVLLLCCLAAPVLPAPCMCT